MDGRPPHAQNMDVLYAAHQTRVIYTLWITNANAPARRLFFCYFSLDEQRKVFTANKKFFLTKLEIAATFSNKSIAAKKRQRDVVSNSRDKVFDNRN